MRESAKTTADDVRMRGFVRRDTVDAALVWLDAQLTPLEAEQVPLAAASSRVLAAPVTSSVDVPGFDRSAMDGYALSGHDTDGATAYNPIAFAVVGDSMPGAPYTATVSRGEAVRVMTGAPMPAGTDAVVPAEWIELQDDARVAVQASVSPGKNVGHRAEDVPTGTELFQRGRMLRPQDLGVLSSVGQPTVSVIRKPRVRLAITGNELLPAGSLPHDFQIADANGPMLSALIERDGGVVDFPGIIRDDKRVLREALEAEADVVIVTGGSSVGVEDFAPMLLAELGDLAIHGIAMRPSSPTGMGRIENKLVFLLPGNPVSALCAYDFFAGRAIRALGGRPTQWPYVAVRGKLSRKISSQIGRLDYARVRIVEGAVQPLAIAGASILSSTTRADGFVIVSDDSEGHAAGAEVEVWLYA